MRMVGMSWHCRFQIQILFVYRCRFAQRFRFYAITFFSDLKSSTSVTERFCRYVQPIHLAGWSDCRSGFRVKSIKKLCAFWMKLTDFLFVSSVFNNVRCFCWKMFLKKLNTEIEFYQMVSSDIKYYTYTQTIVLYDA